MPPKSQTKTIDERLEAWANGIHKAIREDLHRVSKTLEEKIEALSALPERWIDRKLTALVRKRHTWRYVVGHTAFCMLVGAILCSVVTNG